MSEYRAYKMLDHQAKRRATLKMRLDLAEEHLKLSENKVMNLSKMYAEQSLYEERLRDSLEERLRFQLDRSTRLEREKKRDVRFFAIAGPIYGIGIYVLTQYVFGVWF